MAEDYVRPPLLAEEPRSPHAPRWGFRLFFGLVLLAMIVGVFFLIRWLAAGTGEGSPGVNPTGSASAPLRVMASAVRDGPAQAA
ncbi:MAG: hypothetical protein QOF18_1658 [Frankiaceae bacterium]|jgi:hypothetical protein|nr:hypothetical protein [Frankiaceae bacterium]